jgi:hypothetical protein
LNSGDANGNLGSNGSKFNLLYDTCYAAYYYYYQLGTSLGTKDPALGFNVFFSPPVLLGALPNFLLLFIFPNEGAL